MTPAVSCQAATLWLSLSASPVRPRLFRLGRSVLCCSQLPVLCPERNTHPQTVDDAEKTAAAVGIGLPYRNAPGNAPLAPTSRILWNGDTAGGGRGHGPILSLCCPLQPTAGHVRGENFMLTAGPTSRVPGAVASQGKLSAYDERGLQGSARRPARLSWPSGGREASKCHGQPPERWERAITRDQPTAALPTGQCTVGISDTTAHAAAPSG